MLNQSMIKTAKTLGARNAAVSYYLHSSLKGVFVELSGGEGFLVTPTATLKLTGKPASYSPIKIDDHVAI